MRDSLILLAGLALVLLGGELGARFVLPRASAIQGRLARESASSVLLRDSDERAEVLVIGDSLTLHGIVDPAALEAAIGPSANVTRFVMEDTCRLDWVYQLRRLARSGARADVVLLGTRPASFLCDRGFRGAISARLLIDTPDLPELLWRTTRDATHASRMVFAHFSQLAGLREELNKAALQAVFPGYAELARGLAVAHDGPSASPETSALLAGSIGELQAAAGMLGARLVLWFPPVSDPVDALIPHALSAAKAHEVPVIRTLLDGALPASDYTDGYHLSPGGSAKVIPGLAQALRDLL